MHQKQNPAHYGGKSMGRFELQIIMRSDKDGYLAHGMFDGKGVTVFKGSQISVSEQDKKDIRRLRNIGLDESGKLLEDKYFKSPTAASIFVCGQASNGWDEWLTPEGFPLAAYKDIKQDDSVSDTEKEPQPSVKTNHETNDSHAETNHAQRTVVQQVETNSSIALRHNEHKADSSQRMNGNPIHQPAEHTSKIKKMLLCSDVCLGAMSTEKLDIKQSQKWQAARNAKFTDLIDKAAQNNATYVALFGRLFGQERVTESVIDTLFQAVREDEGITVLVFLTADEHKRISYRNDVPQNLHLLNMEKQDSFLDDNIALRINVGTAELQLGDNESIIIQKDKADKFFISGIQNGAVIPSFEPTGFENAQDNKFGFGILEWTEDQLGQYQLKVGSKYAYKAIELKIQPEDDQEEILRKISNAVRKIDIDTFLRITITGRSAFGLTMNSDALKNQLQGRIFFVEVYDNTVMDIDEEAFETDISLRSEFVRLALQDSSLSESERNRLISLGWNALSGREVSAE